MKKYFLLFVFILLLACGKKDGEAQNASGPPAIPTATQIENPKAETGVVSNEVDKSGSGTNSATLQEIPKVESASETVPNPKGEDTIARIVNIVGQREEESLSVEIQLTKSILDGFDPTAFIKVTDSESGFVLETKAAVVKDTIQLRGNFESDRKYHITILKGITALDHSKTQEDTTETIGFVNREPKISFLNSGILLPSSADRSIVLRSINVTKVKVHVWKVFENNFTQFLYDFYFDGNGTSQYDTNLLDNWRISRMAEEVASKEFTINKNQNKWVQTSLDLKGILDGKGIYIVKISATRDGLDYEFSDGSTEWQRERLYYRTSITKAILLTDMALIAQKDGSGKYFVTAMDILKNEPISGAQIYLISDTNQVLGEKLTDKNGTAVFEDNTKKAFYVTASYDEKKSLLKLDAPLSMDGFKVGGAYSTEGIRAFIYTERGVYRPGDKIHVSILARNQGVGLPDDHPIKINVYGPTGSRYIEDAIIKEGKNGFYTYEFSTKTGDNTGIWKLTATIGSHTASEEIMIETVVPFKIQNTIQAPESILSDKESFTWSIDSKYLFGAPASGLSVEGDIVITEEPLQFQNYPNYNFFAPGYYFYTSYDGFSGKLDEKGHYDITTNISNIQYRSFNVLLHLQSRVIEESGRPVPTQATVLVKKFDNYLGIERGMRYIGNKAPLNLKIITPTTDGEKLVAGRELEYKVYYKRYSWWWDYNNYEEFIRRIKSDKETDVVAVKNFTSTENPYVIDFVPEKEGEYYLEVTDLSSNQTTGTSFYVSDWTDPLNEAKLNGLKIGTDKNQYVSGETAVVAFESVKGSKALIAVEQNGKILKRYLREITEDLTKEEIVLDQSMVPNIYVHVSLLQDYQRKNDRSLRLYGTVSLNIENPATKLNVVIDAPETVRPNEKFTVKIKNEQNKKKNYTIAVVDEGLLDLTAFKTPDPWIFYYQKLASLVSLFDNYDSIMERPYGDIHQILKVGGGDFMMDKAARRTQNNLGFEDAERFKPVSLFQGILTTNENGEGTAEFTMPNYMGSVRIMVIAAEGAAYGFAEKTMTVKGPIVLLESLPRTLKINDEFTFPIKVFALEDDIGDIDVYYQFGGNTQKQTVNLKKGEETTLYFSEKIPPEVGLTKVTVGVKSAIYQYEETVGMAVNSNALPIYVNERAISKDGETLTFRQTKEYIKNTVDSFVMISNMPSLGIDKRLKYLITYPYGCLEQTTSAVLPQLFIDKLMTSQNYDKKKVLNNINAGIERICKYFQTSEGGFAYWPGESKVNEWGSNYAATFLILARQKGYYVPDDVYRRLINFIKKRARNRVQMTDSAVRIPYYQIQRSYALYLLALSGNPLLSEMNYTYANEYGKLNEVAKLYLASAYKLAGEEKTAKEIMEESKAKEKLLSVIEPPQYYYDTYGSKIRDLAIYLHTYYTIFGEVDKEVMEYILLQLQSNAWYSTQSTAYALLALSNIVSENSSKEIKGTVLIDGVPTSYRTLQKIQLPIPENAKEIQVIPENQGNTFVNYYWEGVPVNEKIENIVKGFTLERRFYDNDGNPINPRELESGRSFWLEVSVGTEHGQTLKVSDMALVQILPTGWEIENLRVTGGQYPKWLRDKMGDKIAHARYTDIRDDRICWFFDYYWYMNSKRSGPSSVYRFFVKINTVTKGTFEFPGTKLEAMYDDNFQSYLNGYPVRITDKGSSVNDKDLDSNRNKKTQ